MKPRKAKTMTFPSFGATGYSLGGARLPLKKPAKGNAKTLPSFGMTSSSFGGASFLLKKPVKFNDTALPSFSMMAWVAVVFLFLGAMECVATPFCLLSVTARVMVAFCF